nr:unnamed protein product [Digitaria exilis]
MPSLKTASTSSPYRHAQSARDPCSLPSLASLPVISSKRTTPKLYTSTFSFTFLVYPHSAQHRGAISKTITIETRTGSHVAERSGDSGHRVGLAGLHKHPREAEVGDLGVELRVEQDVAGLDVPHSPRAAPTATLILVGQPSGARRTTDGTLVTVPLPATHLWPCSHLSRLPFSMNSYTRSLVSARERQHSSFTMLLCRMWPSTSTSDANARSSPLSTFPPVQMRFTATVPPSAPLQLG